MTVLMYDSLFQKEVVYSVIPKTTESMLYWVRWRTTDLQIGVGPDINKKLLLRLAEITTVGIWAAGFSSKSTSRWSLMKSNGKSKDVQYIRKSYRLRINFVLNKWINLIRVASWFMPFWTIHGHSHVIFP